MECVICFEKFSTEVSVCHPICKKCMSRLKEQPTPGKKFNVESWKCPVCKIFFEDFPYFNIKYIENSPKLTIYCCGECGDVKYENYSCDIFLPDDHYYECEKCRDVSVKSCPRCNVSIEKDGGCNHMECKCGYGFCWICLEDYSKISCTSYVCKNFSPLKIFKNLLKGSEKDVIDFIKNLDFDDTSVKEYVDLVMESNFKYHIKSKLAEIIYRKDEDFCYILDWYYDYPNETGEIIIKIRMERNMIKRCFNEIENSINHLERYISYFVNNYQEEIIQNFEMCGEKTKKLLAKRLINLAEVKITDPYFCFYCLRHGFGEKSSMKKLMDEFF